MYRVPLVHIPPEFFPRKKRLLWASFVVFGSCIHVLCNVMCTCTCSPGARSAASIILRGANDFMVDEMERSVHDALCVVKRVLESQEVVAGGGAVEAALSIFLESLASSIVSQHSGLSIECQYNIYIVSFPCPHFVTTGY